MLLIITYPFREANIRSGNILTKRDEWSQLLMCIFVESVITLLKFCWYFELSCVLLWFGTDYPTADQVYDFMNQIFKAGAANYTARYLGVITCPCLLYLLQASPHM